MNKAACPSDAGRQLEASTQSFVGVDVGGTFTDFSVSIPGRGELVYKLPSTPGEPDSAIVAGLSQLFREHGLLAAEVGRLSHGTTVGTNALIQRRVGRMAIVTTRGFRDLLEIGRQTRPKVYDIHEDHPKSLVPRWLRFEVNERMRADGTIHVPLDEAEVERVGRQLAADEVDCIGVCFLHAHAYPHHEQRAAEILRRVTGNRVIVITSSEVYPEFREYERFSTTVLNGALLTVMHAYLDRLSRRVRDLGIGCQPTVSQSAGGLLSIEMARRFPIRTALSGPAAGVCGAAFRAELAGFRTVITLDVGGTSADVCLLVDGHPAIAHSRMLAGFPLRLPTLDVNSVGAGGGSIAWIDTDGLLKVGPKSAGAVPGPACYDTGGDQATVTDAQVMLGRLNGDALLDGRMPIRRARAEEAIGRLARRLDLPPIDTALGIVQLACAVMVKAIRSISIERGHDPSRFALFAFGGAGPLHATEIAHELEITRIIVPPNSGILCAEGLLNSDLAADFVQAALVPLDVAAGQTLDRMHDALARQAIGWFEREGIAAAARREAWSADLRYRGQNFELSVPFTPAPFDEAQRATLVEHFHAAHDRAYGFAQRDEPVELVNMRIALTGLLDKPSPVALSPSPAGDPAGRRPVCFAHGVWDDTPIYRRSELAPEQKITGPAVIEQMDSTTLIYPGDHMRVDRWGNLVIEID